MKSSQTLCFENYHIYWHSVVPYYGALMITYHGTLIITYHGTLIITCDTDNNIPWVTNRNIPWDSEHTMGHCMNIPYHAWDTDNNVNIS